MRKSHKIVLKFIYNTWKETGKPVVLKSYKPDKSHYAELMRILKKANKPDASIDIDGLCQWLKANNYIKSVTGISEYAYEPTDKGLDDVNKMKKWKSWFISIIDMVIRAAIGRPK